MNKKLIIGIIIAIIVIIAGIVCYAIYTNNQKEIENKNNNELQINDRKTENEENIGKTDKKILVVYYSAQNHTKAVAEKIANNLNADTFEIVPQEVYTSKDLDWTDNNSRVSKEHDNEELRDVKLRNTQVEKWEEYDTVLIGYPIWWRSSSMASK